MRVKQMWLIPSGSPNAFQGVIFPFGQVRISPVCIARERLTSFKFEGQKCVNVNEVNFPFSAPREEKPIQNSLEFGLEMGLCFSSNSVL